MGPLGDMYVIQNIVSHSLPIHWQGVAETIGRNLFLIFLCR